MPAKLNYYKIAVYQRKITVSNVLTNHPIALNERVSFVYNESEQTITLRRVGEIDNTKSYKTNPCRGGKHWRSITVSDCIPTSNYIVDMEESTEDYVIADLMEEE